jgi:hypothetical protein
MEQRTARRTSVPQDFSPALRAAHRGYLAPSLARRSRLDRSQRHRKGSIWGQADTLPSISEPADSGRENARNTTGGLRSADTEERYEENSLPTTDKQTDCQLYGLCPATEALSPAVDYQHANGLFGE